MQTVLHPSIIEHWGSWPTFHSDTSKKTVNYDKPFLILMHDEDAYNQLFSADFPLKIVNDRLHETKVMSDERNDLYPMTYFAERLPIQSENEDEQFELIFELLEILAGTDQMNYFNCGFIQRLVDYMWDSQLVKFYNIISIMYGMSYLLIISSSVLLRWAKSNPIGTAIARITLLSLNLMVLLVSLCTFEIKSLINDGLEYFQSFYNINDICLFIFSVGTLVQEIVQFRKYQSLAQTSRNLEELETEESEEPENLFDPTTYYNYGL